MGRWSGVKCPICKKSFEDCPHSVAQKEAKETEVAQRAIIRDEVLRMKKQGLI